MNLTSLNGWIILSGDTSLCLSPPSLHLVIQSLIKVHSRTRLLWQILMLRHFVMRWDEKQSSILMATLFGDNAHIHYHPLMFVYLIWLDYNLHKGISCYSAALLFTWGVLKGWKRNWIESQIHPESLVTLGAISNQRPATEMLVTPPGQTFIIFHIMLLSLTSLHFQSN